MQSQEDQQLAPPQEYSHNLSLLHGGHEFNQIFTLIINYHLVHLHLSSINRMTNMYVHHTHILNAHGQTHS